MVKSERKSEKRVMFSKAVLTTSKLFKIEFVTLAIFVSFF